MKNILVPTDFSAASKNAIEYAAEFAQVIGAKITLFNVYHTPPVVIEVPVVVPSPEEMKKESITNLEAIRDQIWSTHGKIPDISCACALGFEVDEINTYADKNNIDLIIMGMQGAGWLREKLIGSITTAVIRDGKHSVLSIGESMKFSIPKKIVLAYDYEELDDNVLKPLKEFSKLFDSHLFILNVGDERETVDAHISDQVHNQKIEALFGSIRYSLHYRTNENLVEGINRFIKRHEADLLVMIPREHSIIKNIFIEPSTKQMAFRVNVPLLSVKE